MAQGEPAPGAAAPKKFSFSMAKASNRRPPLPPRVQPAAPEPVVEYVTSVDVEAGVVVANPKPSRGARVVPKQEDSWRPEKRMKNIMMETDATRSTEETFEMETMDAGPKPNVVYGLTVMSRVEVESGVARQMSLKELEDQKLRDDLMNLPEEATLEKYEELPVEEFGEALLRGMGWEKGKPIGRNAKAVVAPIEYVRRQGTLGLGAVPAPPKEINKKYIKPGESRQRRPDVGAAANGRSRNGIDADTNLVASVRRGVAKGKIMSIIAGRHQGLSGEVVSTNDGGDKVVVKLVKSGEKVLVYDDELADVGSSEEESAMRKVGELRTGNGKSDKSQERHSSRAEESRGRSSSENYREDERHSKRGHGHSEEEDERYSKRSHRHSEGEDERYSRRGHRHHEEEDERSSKRGHRHSEGEDERYSKRGHRHHEEEDERSSKRGHRHSEGEDERYSKRGHRHSEGDDRGERRGSKDRSERG